MERKLQKVVLNKDITTALNTLLWSSACLQHTVKCIG